MLMRSKEFKIALAQMIISQDVKTNVDSARHAMIAAAQQEADLCVLPELFTNRYVGQFDDVRSTIAKLPAHDTLIEEFKEISRSESIACVLPFVEKMDDGTCYNSEVLIDRIGKAVAHYRKLHIPNGVGYREDLYFKPGDRGYAVASLEGINIGLGICWDQWFPEFSRSVALRGAEIIVYPSAIGSEIVEPNFDSRPSWELVMRAQAIMNRVYIAAVNRVGQEEIINFYGGSFVADPWGDVLQRASLTEPEIVIANIDLSQISKARDFFGFFDTRRPDMYDVLINERLTRR